MKMIKVVTKKIRMDYVNLFSPKAMMPGEGQKYSVCILIPKTDIETVSKINLAVEAAKRAGISLWGYEMPSNLKTPLRDGDLEKPNYEDYRGHYFLNAVSRRKPEVVNKKLVEIKEEEEVYSGCYGRVSINFYPFNWNDNKGVGCGLINVQKLEDGEPIGTSFSAEEDFGAEDGDKPW